MCGDEHCKNLPLDQPGSSLTTGAGGMMVLGSGLGTFRT